MTAPLRPFEKRLTRTTNGCRNAASLPVAGFAIIAAPTMAEAVRLVSQTPCAVAHGVVEVWPLQTPP